MTSLLWYVVAAIGEIGGCFAFWAWLRMHRSPLWIVPGTLSLIVFAIALTRIDVQHAGRTYAAYGGVYILASVTWLWAVEGVKPDRWDVLGTVIAIAGTMVILFAPRQT